MYICLPFVWLLDVLYLDLFVAPWASTCQIINESFWPLWDSFPVVKCLAYVGYCLFFFFWHLKWSWSEFFECKSWILNVEATYRWPETVEFHILVIELFIFHSPCCPCLRHFGRKGRLTLCLHKEFKLLTYSDKMSGFVLRFLFFFCHLPYALGKLYLMSNVKISEVFIPIFSEDNMSCTQYSSHSVCLVEIWNCLPKSGLYLVDKEISSFSSLCR